jgi:hypothetical protein
VSKSKNTGGHRSRRSQSCRLNSGGGSSRVTRQVQMRKSEFGGEDV